MPGPLEYGPPGSAGEQVVAPVEEDNAAAALPQSTDAGVTAPSTAGSQTSDAEMRDMALASGASPEEADNPLSDIRKRLAEMEANDKESFERQKWIALAEMGFGIMGGESPYFATNVGQGAREGIKSLAALEGDKRRAELERMGIATEVAGAELGQRNKDREFGLDTFRAQSQDRYYQGMLGIQNAANAIEALKAQGGAAGVEAEKIFTEAGKFARGVMQGDEDLIEMLGPKNFQKMKDQ